MFAEQKFCRDGIEVLTGCRVLSVTENIINMKKKSTGELTSLSHGMVVWSTGIGTRPVVMDFMEKIGQVCLTSLLLGLTRNFLFLLFAWTMIIVGLLHIGRLAISHNTVLILAY